MKISEVLARKGTDVVTVGPQDTVQQLVQLLTEHNIGAVVVLDGDRICGIVSERDIARRLRPRLAEAPVAEIMTTEVQTCAPDDDVATMAGEMTQRHIRHLPVVENDRLVAIVSIGDIVKTRIQQLQEERDHLEGYITQ